MGYSDEWKKKKALESKTGVKATEETKPLSYSELWKQKYISERQGAEGDPVTLLQNYQARINNNEYLSPEDFTSFRSAIDSYISGVESSRMGKNYTPEEEQKWQDDKRSLNDYYDAWSSYYKNFQDADVFDAYKTFDLDRYNENQEEISRLRNELENIGFLENLGEEIVKASSKLSGGANAWTRKEVLEETLARLEAENAKYLGVVDPDEYARLKKIEAAPGWERGLATIGDLLKDAGYGVTGAIEKTIESIPRAMIGASDKLFDGLETFNDYTARQSGRTMVANRDIGRFIEKGRAKNEAMVDDLNFDFMGEIHDMDDDTRARLSYLSEIPQVQGTIKDITHGVSNMVPAIAATAITKNPAVGQAVFFANAAGASAEEASLAGAKPSQAAGYGLAIGALETATEKLGGSVFGEATDLASTWFGRQLIKNGMDQYVSQGIGKAAYTIGSEGFEELIMDVVTPGTKAAFDIGDAREKYFGKDWKSGWEEVLEGLPKTFAVGGTVGIVLEGFHTGSNVLTNIATGAKDKGGLKGGLAFNKIASEMNRISEIIGSNEAVRQSKLSQEKKNQYTLLANQRIAESLGVISEKMQSFSEEQRDHTFEAAPVLAKYLNKDGTVMTEITESLASSTKAAQDSSEVSRRGRTSAHIESFDGLNEEQIREKIEKRLSTQIEDKAQRSEIANIMTEIVQGRKVTNVDIKKITGNGYALKVLNDYLGTSFNAKTSAKEIRVAVAERVNDYSPTAQAKLYAAVLDMGEEGARGLMMISQNLPVDADLGNVAQAYNALYQAGVQGKAINEAKNPYIASLDEQVREYAYQTGVVDGLMERGRKNSSEVMQNGKKDAKINNKENVENEQGVRIRDGGERDGGQDPGRQVSAVESGAGKDQSRREGKSRPRDREAASLTYGEEVSAKSLGIKGGLDSGRVHLIAEGSETNEMKKARARAEKRGKKVTFFAGENLRIEQDDVVISARGYIEGDNVYVRVDHPYYTADQLMRHELGHDMIARGEVDVDEVRERIKDRYEDIDFIVERYVEAYEGSGLGADEIWEEIICDSLGDMNIFAPVEVLGEMNDEFLEVLKEETRKNAKDARGPPRSGAKFSISPTLESELDTVLNGTFDASKNEVYLGETSNFMTDIIGAEALSLYMPASKAYSSLVTEEEYNKKPYYSKQDNYHGIGKADFIKILEKSEEPIVAFAAAPDEDGNKRRNRIVLVTDVKIWDVEHKHLDYAVVIEEVDTKARVNGKRIDANKTISIYPRSQLIQDILMALSDHRLLDITKKGEHLFAGGRGSNPQAAIRKDVLEKNIAHFWANVKWEKQNNTTFSTKETEMPSAFQIALEKAGYFDQDGHSKYMQENDDLSHKKDKSSGKSSQDLDFVDFLNENADKRERSNREILANLLETEDMSPSEKGFLTKYKNKIAQIEAKEAEISEMESELKELRKAGKKDSARAITLEGKIDARRKEIARDENMILNLESTNSIKRLLKREKDAAYAEGMLAGQMAQGRRDAAKLRESEEKLAEQKRKDGETLAEYKKRVSEREAEIKQQNREKLAEQKRQARRDVEDAHLAGRMAQGRLDAAKLDTAKRAFDAQAKRYQEARKKGVEGRYKTAMRHKIAGVVSELDKLLRKGTKERNVKIGLQDAVASALELFDMNEEKVERYNKAIADLDARIASATDPIEIEALTALREKKVRNSERLADKLQVMKKAYEDIHNGRDGENYPSYYKAECEAIENRIAEVMEKVGDTPIGDMSLEQLESVYDMYRMILTTVQNANKIFKEGKLADLTEDAAAMTAELQRIKKLAEERLKAGDGVRGFVWNELTPYYAFNRIGSETLMSYYEELIRGQDVYARDIEEAQKFAEDTRKKHGYSKWQLDQVHSFKDKDGRDFRLTLRHMMSIYAYSKREQAFDHMEKGGFFFNNKETFRKKAGVLEFIASNESGYKVDARVFAQIKGALTEEQIAYVDEMQAYLTKMGEKGNEVTRVMWGIDIFKEAVYFPLKSKEDFIYQANTPAETSSLKNDGMTKETRPHASNPIVLESFDDVWANHVEKMSKYHGFVIPIDNLNKLINYGTWIEGKKITPGMSDAERYSILKNKVIENVPKAGALKPGTESGISDWGDINTLIGKEKRNVIQRLASEFGVFKGYENKDIEISFDFSSNNFRESYSKQGKRYAQFAKLFSVFDQVVENAIGIEVHNRNNSGYKPDPTLNNIYVLMSAFEDGDSIIPVKLEIKEFNDKQNTLYVAITMEAIEKAEVWKSGSSDAGVAQSSRSANISISHIFEKINTSDQNFLKYVPDGFLTAEQIEAKKQALEKDGVKYSPSSASDLEGFSMGSHSISTMLEARFGPGVNEYLNTFIKDLNGAKAQSGGLLGSAFNLLSKFKKTSVAASLSVVVQQPTAIIRALSEIDARYFVGMPKPEILNRKWERMKKYAPIVILKDIGGFDAGSGKQINEWINADTKRGVDKAMNKADDLTMYGAALGDRIGWASIWTAIERDVKAKQKLEYGSEAFYEAVGKRFTEVIVKTQVYDSTLSRSGFMRGKDGLMKMATAFMGEPTLSVNMMADAILQAKRGKIKKAKAVRVIASVYVATVAASVIKSLIYALRDDDEDESYAEKYLQALGGTILNDINPLNMLPIFRDVVSIFDGWDVERTDMALVADLKNAIDALNSDTKSTWRKIEDFAGAIAAFAGVPLKNVMRTAREIYNLIESLFDGIDGGDLGGAFLEGITGKEDGKRESMYNALISGDPERIEIYRESYDSEDKYLSAVKQALRECDPRVQRGVEGVLSGNYSVYNEMKADVRSEKHFDVKTVTNAFADEKEYVLGKLNDARKARREGNSEEFDKIVQKLIERGYSRSFILKKLK